MEKEERKYRKLLIRRNELIVWVCILSILVLIGVFIFIRHEESFEHHNIYMPDVDGLIVGSPVHMMGISIGYVNKVKIINENEIKVRFKITNKNIHVPPGTFATVEFSGLGGSKSLELYPPSSGKYPNEIVGRDGFILVDRPKRLRDSMSLLYQMYQKLMDIMYTSANFGKEVKELEKDVPVSGGVSDINNFIDYSNKYLNNYENSVKQIKKIINRREKSNDGK